MDTKKLDEQKENLDPRSSNGQVAGEPSCEFSENFHYDCDSLKAKHVADHACDSSTLVPLVEETSQMGLYRTEVNLEGVSQTDQHREAASCDWESLICDASDLLNLESPDDTELFEKSVDPATTFYKSIKNAMQNMHSICPVEQVGERSESEITDPSPKMDYEVKIALVLLKLELSSRELQHKGYHFKHLNTKISVLFISKICIS